MDYHPILCGETLEESTSECFDIKQGDKNYKLNIKLFDNIIESCLSEENLFLEIYKKRISKNEIISRFSSFKEFLGRIKNNLLQNSLYIKNKSDALISIELNQDSFSFELSKYKLNSNLITANFNRGMLKLITDMNNLTNKYEDIFQKNKSIKEEIDQIKKENENLKEENKNFKNLNLELTKIKKSQEDLKENMKKEIEKLKNSITIKDSKKINKYEEIKEIKKLVDDVLKLKEEIKYLKTKYINANANTGQTEKKIEKLKEKNIENIDEKNIKNRKVNIIVNKRGKNDSNFLTNYNNSPKKVISREKRQKNGNSINNDSNSEYYSDDNLIKRIIKAINLKEIISRQGNPKNIEFGNYKQNSINKILTKPFIKTKNYEPKIYTKKTLTKKNSFIGYNTDNEGNNKNKYRESIEIQKTNKKDSTHKKLDSLNYKQNNIKHEPKNEIDKRGCRFNINKICNNKANLLYLYSPKNNGVFISKNNEENKINSQYFKSPESSEINYPNIYSNNKKMNDLIYHKKNIQNLFEEERTETFCLKNNYFDMNISGRDYNKNKSALKKGSLSQNFMINKFKEYDEHYETNPNSLKNYFY